MKRAFLPAIALLLFVASAPAVPQKKPHAEPIVYATKTGTKYHEAWCSYLRKSKVKMKLSEAKRAGLTPCSRCQPPK